MATLTFPAIEPSSISFGIRYSTQINISPLSGSVQTIEIPGARWAASLSFSDMEPAEGRELAAFIAQLRGSSGRFFLFDFSHRNPRGSNLAAGNVTVDVRGLASIESGVALGTHSTTTLQDTNKTFITTGIISIGDWIHNETLDQFRKIASFTEDTITVETAWTTPADTNVYTIYPAPTGNTIPTQGWNVSQSNLLLPGDYIELENSELKIVTSAVNSDISGKAVITFEPPIRTSPNDASVVKRADCQAVMLVDVDEIQWTTDNAGLLIDLNFSCIEGF